MATDYSTQINAWFEAIQQRPAPQAAIVSYNAILAAAGYNFRRILAWLRLLCAWFMLLMTLNRSQNYQPVCA